MSLRFLTAGESHGPKLTAILDGFPAGFPINISAINQDLSRRQTGYGAGPRMKIESDTATITGGIMENLTTGAPISIEIENKDHVRWKGKPVPAFTNPRPGHADLAGAIKYNLDDLRPALERASARETAARVAVGSICRQLLSYFGINIGGYVSAIGSIEANLDAIPIQDRHEKSLSNEVFCPEPQAASLMQATIREIMTQRDTLGGVIEVVVLGLPVGLGSYVQWDRKLEARLGAAILSIPAIKGVEIGPAFANARLPGTQVQDPILLDGTNLQRPSSRNGGTEGGISTGQPLVIRAAMKPIATTLTPQSTVNLSTGNPEDTRYERSDFCPVPRAVVILESMVAFTLADAFLEKTGGDSLAEIEPRFFALRRARLEDLTLRARDHIFWPGED